MSPTENISEEHRLSSHEAVLVGLLRANRPVTIDELMRYLLPRAGMPWTPDRIRPACSELRKKSLPEKFTDQNKWAGKSRRGCPAALWSLTPAGRVRAQNLVDALSVCGGEQ